MKRPLILKSTTEKSLQAMAPQQRTTAPDVILTLNEDGRAEAFGEQPELEATYEHDTAVGCYFYLKSSSTRTALVSFQYKGEDRSLLYRFVLSPLASFFVDYLTPSYVAPNTITFIGLIFMFVSYCFMWYYVPSFQEQHQFNSNKNLIDSESTSVLDVVPRWVFLYHAIAILFYQTLDNMDGKQARKTGASSPLGLLFDHGCDAINSLFGSANWIISMGLDPVGNNVDLILCCLMLFLPYALFYIGTWEEFYTGKLILPIFNGPNEGLLGASILTLVSFLYGPSYWHDYSWWNNTTGLLFSVIGNEPFLGRYRLRNADLLLLVSLAMTLQEVVGKVFNVVKAYGIHTLKSLVPFFTLVVCYVTVGIITVSPQSNDSSHMLWLKMPRVSLHLCAVLFVEMTTDLMLRHMTSQEYPPFRWSLLPLILMTCLVIVDSGSKSLEYANDFLLIYTTAAMTFLTMKMAMVIHEMCTVLNIWCFDIVTPRSTSRNEFDEEEEQSQSVQAIDDQMTDNNPNDNCDNASLQHPVHLKNE